MAAGSNLKSKVYTNHIDKRYCWKASFSVVYMTQLEATTQQQWVSRKQVELWASHSKNDPATNVETTLHKFTISYVKVWNKLQFRWAFLLFLGSVSTNWTKVEVCAVLRLIKKSEFKLKIKLLPFTLLIHTNYLGIVLS